MKVLFICSGNNKSGIGSIVRSQGESLSKAGVEVEYYAIVGRGILNYLKSVFILKKKIKNDSYCLFHAHYSFSGFAAALAGCKPLVVSLMGSDVHKNNLFRSLIDLFARHFWQATIVKSIQMEKRLHLRHTHVIPNGVAIDLFKPSDRKESMEKSGFADGINIIFVADPERQEKNFRLAQKAVERMVDTEVHLHVIFGKSHKELLWYYNAADILLLTSLWEGSPNVLKEAMACNCPLVTTDIGDVRWVLGNTEGCYISSFELEDLVSKIKLAIDFSKKNIRTKGRERIIKLGLDSQTIARKILSIYEHAEKNK